MSDPAGSSKAAAPGLLPGDRVAEFTAFRQRMNERILAQDNQVVRRFFALDTQTYKDGAVDVKTKEMLGLVASLVLRCDDCISYHVAQCRKPASTATSFRVFSVGLVVGGSIVIPPAAGVDFLDRLEGGSVDEAVRGLRPRGKAVLRPPDARTDLRRTV
jgi:AhpD family alkylhydroperoxidase